MKKEKIIIVVSLFFVLNLIAISQAPKYPTKNINGLECYQYVVEASEGLFGISHKFGVSVTDIVKLNPEVEKGIKVGQTLNIPVVNKNSKSLESNYTEHKVEKKQTIFAICKTYNITQDELVKHNPALVNGLVEGSVLKIPKTSTVNNVKESEVVKLTPTADRPKKSNITHIVQPKETLYSISKEYQVDVADLIQLNPLAANGLNVNMQLSIPVSKENRNKAADITEANNLPQKTELETEKLFNDTAKSVHTKKTSKSVKIAYLLPFMLNSDKLEGGNDRFVDFYSGALLAIKKLKERGISIDVITFDTDNSEEKIKDILEDPSLKTVDLIIGPAYSVHIPLVANFAKIHKIHTLIPFSSKILDIEKNSYIFQFNPGLEADLHIVDDIVNNKLMKANIIFAEISDVNLQDGGKIWASKLQTTLLKEKRAFSTIKLLNAKTDNFKTVLKSNMKNVIVFNTDKFAYINSYIPQLRIRATEYDLALFIQYSWKSQSVKMPPTIYVSPFESKIDSTNLTQFNHLFKSNFHRETPINTPRFDLLGYDMTNYFVSGLSRFGDKFFVEVNSYNNQEGIQSQPLFEKTSKESGYVNQQLYFSEDK